MDGYFELIGHLVARYAYWFVFFGLLLENTAFLGLFIPGLLILLFAGFSAGLGQLDPFLCVLAGIAGTFTGDNLSFALGRYGKRFPRVRKLIERSETVIGELKTQGLFVLLFFQFPVYLRVAVPLIMGSVGYPFKRWLLLDAVASILFNTTFVVVGYFIARTTGLFSDATLVTDRIQFIFVGIFAVWLAAFLLGVRKKRRRKALADAAQLIRAAPDETDVDDLPDKRKKAA